MTVATRLARNWLAAFFDPRRLLSLVYLPRYLSHWHSYERLSVISPKLADSHPCLTDWATQTPFDPHYFFQAAWLARRIAKAHPERHVDIGSDVRMINVLSAFVATEFIDYRPLRVDLDGLECSAGNLTALGRSEGSIASLSCLHVVEHVGLGRYGDPIDPDGSHKALRELQRVLASKGLLYLSLPVGRERVCFNAHRVFDPQTIVAWLPELRLVEFSLVDDQGAFLQHQPLDNARGQEYACGMFAFEKP